MGEGDKTIADCRTLMSLNGSEKQENFTGTVFQRFISFCSPLPARFHFLWMMLTRAFS